MVGVGLGKGDAVSDEFVEVRGGGVAAVESDVCPAEVISDDEDDVGWGGLKAGGEAGDECGQDSHGR